VARSLRSALFLLVLLLLGCRTIGGEQRVVAAEREHERTAEHELAAASIHAGAPDGMFAYTHPGQLPRLLVAGEGPDAMLPLKHTDVDARVRGHVAQVRVTQQFHNDRARAIEVTYTFPLPENAAVDDMRMVIGERTIESEVQTRARARQIFEEARHDGHTAALLEQERPNIFTQSVTNVAPGETVEVEITYLQTLTQDGSTFEFVFPMVVGPRFVPPGDAVPDAARINPPILGEGLRTGNDVSLTISVEAGAEVASVVAPTHAITSSMSTRGFAARLRDSETIPNRDFVLRWQLGGSTASATLFTSKPDAHGDGHFALVIQPPQLDLDAVVGRRELIFVVDRSGSMAGQPLALAKQTLRESLKRLRPVDTFDVIGFESWDERLFDSPRPANEENLVLAERFIDGMDAGGGTMMAGAVEAALAPKLSPGTNRYVMFLTDGYIGNEAEIFASAAKLVRRAKAAESRARVFGIGIGAAPNRELIEGLSKAGDGAALYVGNREHPGAAVDGYFRFVDHPVLEQLAVDWGELVVEEVYPTNHLNLFASRSVVVHGRYRGDPGDGAVTVRATVPGTREGVELPVTIVHGDVDDRILTTLWARAKLAELVAANWDGDLSGEEARDAITQIGLEYRLVTAYTSFVAVDRSRVIGDGQPDRIAQPVEVPEDVNAELAGARIMSVTAGRPALSGLSEVEDKYAVNGFAVSSAAAGTVGKAIIQEYVEVIAPPDTSLFTPIDGRSSWEAVATLRIRRLSASEGVDTSAFTKALKSQAMKIEACFEQRGDGSGTRRLRYRLRFDARGELLEVELLDGSLGPRADACAEAVLRGIAWRGLPSADANVTIELQLRMW
jgi:Ca-activated chloride channel family protein